MTTTPDMSDMTPEELAIADDFEKGWSDERLDAAGVRWGPGLVDALPHVLAKKIAEQAQRDGTSDLQVIQTALFEYFNKSAA